MPPKDIQLQAGPIGEPKIPPSPHLFPPLTGVAENPGDIPVNGLHTGGGTGVVGESKGGDGIFGTGAHNGVVGRSAAAEHSGVWADNTGAGYGVAGTSAAGIGVFASGGRLAAQFVGDVEVSGDIRLVNADCAEHFDITGERSVEPGTVMIIDDTGGLQHSERPYDKRVAGVIAGAGNYRPAIILDNQNSSSRRQPIALIGKAYCKVDAQYSPVEVGDLLTTSPTPGHAMKADDPLKAFGAVIGKALGPLREGLGMIPILIALQ